MLEATASPSGVTASALGCDPRRRVLAGHREAHGFADFSGGAGLTAQETASGIGQHLQLAGRSGPLFSDEATALIHATGRDLPGAVSNLAIQALIAAYAGRKAIVCETSARTAAAEVTAD